MVVQETGIPTGFQPDIDSIGKVPGLKRTEVLDRKVALYLDQVCAFSSSGVRFMLDRVHLQDIHFYSFLCFCIYLMTRILYTVYVPSNLYPS